MLRGVAYTVVEIGSVEQDWNKSWTLFICTFPMRGFSSTTYSHHQSFLLDHRDHEPMQDSNPKFNPNLNQDHNKHCSPKFNPNLNQDPQQTLQPGIRSEPQPRPQPALLPEIQCIDQLMDELFGSASPQLCEGELDFESLDSLFDYII